MSAEIIEARNARHVNSFIYLPKSASDELSALSFATTRNEKKK
jgi:hypothetical protein